MSPGTVRGDVGPLPEASLRETVKILQGLVDDGTHYGAQLSVYCGDRSFDLCVGEAAPGVPMESSHVLCWSSSVKPLVAVALAQLEERGLLSLEDPVAKYLPSFAQQGKAAVTIAHCLTHTAGLWDTMRKSSGPPAAVLEHICAQPLAEDWVPGQRCGYDSPAWYVLAGVVSAVDPTHRPYEQYCEEELFRPLGLASCSVGMSAARYEELSSSGRYAMIYNAPRGGARNWKPIPGEDRAESVTYPCPAGKGYGPAKELATLYRSLLPRRQAVLGESAAERLALPRREGMVDELQGVDTAWSLGFAVKSVLSGRHASPRAFGHGGSQSSWAFADPEHDLALACLCNGKPGPALHYKRVGAVSTAVYEDLGLATPEGGARSFKLPSGMGTF